MPNSIFSAVIFPLVPSKITDSLAEVRLLVLKVKPPIVPFLAVRFPVKTPVAPCNSPEKIPVAPLSSPENDPFAPSRVPEKIVLRIAS